MQYFSTAKMVTRTHLDVTFIHTLHVLSKIACCRRPPRHRYTHTVVLRAPNSEQLATIEHHKLFQLPSSYHATSHSLRRKKKPPINTVFPRWVPSGPTSLGEKAFTVDSYHQCNKLQILLAKELRRTRQNMRDEWL
jgi:hypothetical protein